MNYYGDIKFFQTTLAPADISMKLDASAVSNDVYVDLGMETAILISLFTDARASVNDVLPDDSTDRKGWWGDEFRNFPIGSKLWLLGRSKITESTMGLVEQYCKEALAWMVEDGVADDVKCTAQRMGTHSAHIQIILVKNTPNIFFRFYLNWKNQIAGGEYAFE